MFELDFETYRRAENAFAELIPLHGSVAAVLAGAAEGRVLVDDPDRPAVALLHGPEGVYLGGLPHGGVDFARLRAAIDGWAYLYPDPRWLGRRDAVLPHGFMQVHERVRLAMVPGPACRRWRRPA